MSRKIKEQYQVKTAIINYVGAVIGAHSGPGTMALFFVGDEREKHQEPVRNNATEVIKM